MKLRLLRILSIVDYLSRLVFKYLPPYMLSHPSSGLGRPWDTPFSMVVFSFIRVDLVL